MAVQFNIDRSIRHGSWFDWRWSNHIATTTQRLINVHSTTVDQRVNRSVARSLLTRSQWFKSNQRSSTRRQISWFDQHRQIKSVSTAQPNMIWLSPVRSSRRRLNIKSLVDQYTVASEYDVHSRTVTATMTVRRPLHGLKKALQHFGLAQRAAQTNTPFDLIINVQ